MTLNRFPECWKIYKLRELVDPKRGITYGVVQPGGFLKERGVPILKVNNLTERNFSIANAFRISEEVESKYERSRLTGNEILVSLVGSLGYMYNVKSDLIGWNVVRAIGVLPIKKEYDKEWIYWYMKSPDIQREFHSQANTTVQATLNLKELRDIEIKYPDTNYRKKATSILNSLEDKIELNLQMNKTLEAIAQAIFKEWFVDFRFPGFDGEFVEGLPKGWKIGKLNQIAKIDIGRTPPRMENQWFSTNNCDIKWISIRDLGNSGIYIFNTAEYLTAYAIEKFRIPIIPPNTLVLSFKLTIGRVAITTENMVSNEAIAQISTEKFESTYLYCLLKNYNFDILGSTSSIANAVNSKIIKEMDVLIPKEEIVDAFCKVITPLFNKIKSNSIEIETLTNIRDNLLPRLMTGKIRVN